MCSRTLSRHVNRDQAQATRPGHEKIVGVACGKSYSSAEAIAVPSVAADTHSAGSPREPAESRMS